MTVLVNGVVERSRDAACGSVCTVNAVWIKFRKWIFDIVYLRSYRLSGGFFNKENFTYVYAG